MLRITTWLALAALAGCGKKTTRPPADAAPATEVVLDASVQSKLDEAARVKGDIHAPRPDEPTTKPPRNPGDGELKERR